MTDKRFDDVASIPSGVALERRKPARDPSVPSDVVVPALRALVWGFPPSVLALVVLRYYGWPWWIAALVWVVMFMAAWWLEAGSWHSTLWIVERATNQDVNGDGVVGQPQTVVKIERDDGWQNVHFAQPPDKLAVFASGVLSGKPLAEGSWIGGNGPFSLSEYRAMRDELLAVGAIRWLDPEKRNRGLEVTPAGRRILGRLAGGYTQTHTHTKRAYNVLETWPGGEG